MSIRRIAFSLMATVSICAAASAGEAVGIVTKLLVRDSDGLIYVHLGTAPASRAACAANTSYWMIPNENSETGKKLYALLLGAKLAEQTVHIVGKNTCVRWGDGEDINYVNLQ